MKGGGERRGGCGMGCEVGWGKVEKWREVEKSLDVLGHAHNNRIVEWSRQDLHSNTVTQKCWHLL